MTESVLLAAVLADPDDDAPRLILADWYDENGQSERAEFIRVQCALAQLPQCGPGCNYECMAPPFHELSRRQLALWDGGAHRTMREGTAFSLLRIDTATIPRYQTGDVWGFVRRGWIDTVTLSAADWLAHADAITARHPIAEVTLTTWPSCGCSYSTLDGTHRVYPRPGGEGYVIVPGKDGEIERVLGEEWPRIKFTLPPVPQRPAAFRLEGQIPPGGSAPPGAVLLAPRESIVLPSVDGETSYITNTSDVNSLAVSLPR